MSTQRVVLVHAGICDNRMWDAFAPLLGERDVIRHELHAGDLEAAMGGPAVLVGASFGGFLCLDLAARRPDLVEALVVMDAGLIDHEASPDLEAYELEEDRLLEMGDLDSAARLNVEFWVGDAAPEVKRLVLEMCRRVLELDYDPELPEAIDLERVKAPALVLTGERDHPNFQAIAERLAAGIPDARRHTVADAQHLPALERPEQTAAAVLEFLERVS